VNAPVATGAVTADVFTTVVYAVFDPVTRTATVVPRADAGTVHAALVAPGTAAPPTSHWYFSDTGDGPHVPGVAVSVEATATDPEIVGVAETSVPGFAAAVAFEVVVTVVYPDFVPVTRTATVWPSAVAGTVHVALVAPETALPATSHWNVRETGDGPQVPGVAVRVAPTFTDPEIVGVGGATRVPRATAAVDADAFVVVV